MEQIRHGEVDGHSSCQGIHGFSWLQKGLLTNFHRSPALDFIFKLQTDFARQILVYSLVFPCVFYVIFFLLVFRWQID
jgi:hypothetical protein